ncbi:MAG: esterase-like activity of phytase family protein [Hyphomicrobiaceae bacterium]|nr:esterase-like activity of phytase family protein [Hyphomicrobiaceae bacterium]
MPILKRVLAALLAASLSAPALAQPALISARPIFLFDGVPPGQQVQGLVWRGGLVLDGPAEFGGLSGITFLDSSHFVAVSDKGYFVTGRLETGADGTPANVREADISVIRNSHGADLPENYSRDAEAVETIVRDGKSAAIRVGFENLTRVADFEISDFQPVGAAKEVAIPDWLSNLRTNESLEAVCIAPPASPISGSTLLLTEGAMTNDGDHSAFLLGHNDRGPITLVASPDLKPTDCAFLPNGDLLVLERGTGFLSFTMQIRRIRADDVKPGARMRGQIILSAAGGDIDNMEGIAVRQTEGGASRIVIVSDDNYNDWERTLWLEFELPPEAR